MSIASKQVVVILGAGPGLGLSLARIFAKEGHPVALLSRTQSKLDVLAEDLQKETGAPIKGYAVTASDPSSMKQVFSSIKKDLGSPVIGIQNAAGGFATAPFKQLKLEQLEEGIEAQLKGGFLFAQEILESIESLPEFSSKEPSPNPAGALFFTGALFSVNAVVNYAGFSMTKSGARALSLSLSKEYHPKGVHVTHFVVDGPIDSDFADKLLGPKNHPEARMKPDEIAENYLSVWRQKRSAWTAEMDLRSFSYEF